VVIKNTFLSNPDGAARALRKEFLESCNLHTVLDCSGGTFQGAGVKTVVLFFEKGAPTRKIWYYQIDPGRSLGKKNSLNDEDLQQFVAYQSQFRLSGKSWSRDINVGDESALDLSPKNPNRTEGAPTRAPEDMPPRRLGWVETSWLHLSGQFLGSAERRFSVPA
jgi:type I restriction enzyme M protein